MPLLSFYYRQKRCFHPIFNWSGIFVLILISITSPIIKPVVAAEYNTCTNTDLNDQVVYIYYFHTTPRCDECIILEKALLQVLNDHYAQELTHFAAKFL